MLNVSGYAAQGPTQPLTPFKFQRRTPGAHDVRIEIKYCGVCHSDLHQARGEWNNSIFPMVPGHEIAGIVAQVGPEVTRFKVGDKVGVGCFVDSCRACDSCREGVEQYCERGMILTYNGLDKDGKTPMQGGYSSQIVVDEKYVLRFPENMPLDRGAPLLCAGITTYSPLRHWQVGPGKKVAVMGLGGLGHMAVKIASAMGAEVTVLSQSLRKEDDGIRFGAKEFYATSDAATFDKLRGKFDLVLNTVSADIDWNKYLQLLRRDGTMVVVGIPPTPAMVHAASLISNRISLAGSNIGGIKETQEMLDFCAKHKIASDIELIPIDKINDAYERMLMGDVRYRFVIDIASLRG